MSRAKEIVEQLRDPMQTERVHLGGQLHIRFWARNAAHLIIQSDHPAGEGRIVAAESDLTALRDVLVELYPLPSDRVVDGNLSEEQAEHPEEPEESDENDTEEPEEPELDEPAAGRKGRKSRG